jgi:hypothetical protein
MTQQSEHLPDPSDEAAPQGDQSELDLGVLATGDAAVDEALRALERLADRSVAEHPQVFEEVHERIEAAMTTAGADEESAGTEQVLAADDETAQSPTSQAPSLSAPSLGAEGQDAG